MVEQSNTLKAAGGDARVRRIRFRRMWTALLRGFGTTTLWSTGSIAPPVMLSLFPMVSWPQLVRYGFALAVMLMALGWVLDRLQWPRAQRTQAAPATSTDTAAAAPPPMGAVGAPVCARRVLGAPRLGGRR